MLGDSPVTLMEGRSTIKVAVENTGDRPVQVGSHFHFAEANPALQFDRAVAMGKRLAIAAGTSVRFEPGIQLEVELVDFAGARFHGRFPGRSEGRRCLSLSRSSLRRTVRPDCRGPGAAGGHRPVHRSHRGPVRRPGPGRRRSCLRRGQGRARVHGPGPRHTGRRSARTW